MLCDNCGKELLAGVKFCIFCNAQVEPLSQSIQEPTGRLEPPPPKLAGNSVGQTVTSVASITGQSDRTKKLLNTARKLWIEDRFNTDEGTRFLESKASILELGSEAIIEAASYIDTLNGGLKILETLSPDSTPSGFALEELKEYCEIKQCVNELENILAVRKHRLEFGDQLSTAPTRQKLQEIVLLHQGVAKEGKNKGTFYIYTDMDEKKLASFYLRHHKKCKDQSINPKQVVAYYDNTLLGNGDEGAVIGLTGVGWTIDGGGMISWKDISSCKISGLWNKKLEFRMKNGNTKSMVLTQGNKGAKSLQEICAAVLTTL